MKLTLVAAGLTVLLAACTNIEPLTQQNSVDSTARNTTTASLVQNEHDIKIASNLITLEQIMADPDWFGRSAEAWYWGDDSQTILYEQKQLGNPLRDLWIQPINASNSARQVSLADQHKFVGGDGKKNKKGNLKVYLFKGNIFVKNLVSKTVKQITHTSANATDVMFLTNGQIAYRVGNVFYAHILTTGQVVELANLRMENSPNTIAAPISYLAKEQHKLIKYIALQQRNNVIKEQHNNNLTKQNHTITSSSYYFGENNRVSHASLSPAGDKLLVSITLDKESRDDTDIMPNYVTNNGKIVAEKVRARIANNVQYHEEIFMIDLKKGQKYTLNYNQLPDFDTDVLAEVKKENYAREGKKYKSKNQPRNMHLMSMSSPVKWNEDGSKVALMLGAWDNKTRWLTTIDFTKQALVNQHKLQDDAWINWQFNEFDWVGNNALYYVSEESGFAHLYYKTLNDGKTLQLTSGEYEVSHVTLTYAISTNEPLTKTAVGFIFTANKNHPGIYEVYHVDLTKKVRALTHLGGKNDYALSPDETTLLIEHSSLTMPPELYVQSIGENTKARQLTHTVSEQFKELPWVTPSIVAIASSNQQEPIYSRVYLPKNYDSKGVKNRAVMFTHGAGYLQNSHLGWSGYFREFMFHSMLVQQGYVVIDMDYRASAGYGRDWRTSIYRHMGKVEVEDMRDGVQWIVNNANVDPKRVGTYGGSYGGFLTLMAMFTDPTLFASGSAIRLVSDWAYYNHGYTSRILNTPKDDPIAFERSSPIYFAQGLEKPLLINAPMVDDNVFFEDTVRLVQRLIELEKQDFETAIYPVEPHGFVQPSSWLNEYRRIYKLFEQTL